MLKNYFLVFLRNITRQPVYSFLNLSGLAVGMAAGIFIVLYLDFELNYDRVHQRAEQIYRINTSAVKTHAKVMEVSWQTTPANLGPYLLQDFPEVESFVRFFNFYSNNVRFEYGQTQIEAVPEQVIAVDSNVFQVFSFDLQRGDPENALKGPNKIVISENLAGRIFGTENPIGKILDTELVHRSANTAENYPLQVSGVFRDLPENTHLYFHAMISAETDPELNNYYFNRFNVYTYVVLNEQAASTVFAPKLTAVYDKYLDPALDPVLVNATHELMPLPKIHLNESGGSTYLFIFGGVGLLLLLIAFISYVNLVTAQAGRRALEIGLRKVMGSDRKQLIVQFISESLFFTLLALTLALALVAIFAAPLNSLLDLHLDAQQLIQPRLILILLGIVVLLGVIGGSYPAFFLAAFQPISVMKGSLARSTPLRKYLVGFQFTVVIFVLASTGMIYRQLQFLKQKDLGFAKDQILQLAVPGDAGSAKTGVLIEALKRSPNILSVATSDFVPGLDGMVNRPASAKGSEPQFIRYGRIDYDYLETMEIDLIAGRNFSPDFPADSTMNVLVNQTFVHRFELGNNPIGEQVRFGDWGNPNSLRIIGIIEDFHQRSLHFPIEPQLFLLGPDAGDIVVKVSSDPAAAIGAIEKTWTELFPEEPFTYSFLDETLSDRYREDQRRGSLFLFFSLITIFISFAGLYGLAAYLTSQRTREVGIRKVLGAGTLNIVVLFTRDFLLLAVIASVPGLILAWFMIRQWLENFAYRTPMDYVLFSLVLVALLMLTFLTVGWHAARAASLNPKESLKYE